MKRPLLLLMLTVCCLLLTACYTDHDPWREAVFSSTAAPVVTAVPATAVPPTAVPATSQPTAAPTPLPEDAVDVSPNFNG